jgi:hypothetical protein
MKRIIIAALVVLALGVAGCSVGSDSGSGNIVEDAGVEMPDSDTSNPFAIEPADEAEDDISDDVVVEDVDEGDDAVIVEEEPAQVELLTDEGDVDLIAEAGEAYSQTFKVANYGAEYEWDVAGLPSGSGLALENIDSNASKVKLVGTLTSDAVGTHQVTVTVRDAADPSNEDSMSFAFVVESGLDFVIGVLPSDPCEKPLRIEVVKGGNYNEREILDAGEFDFEIGSEVKIEVRAMRGDLPPKGDVTWEVSSEVEDSRHCHFVNEGETPTDYVYRWPMGETCRDDNGQTLHEGPALEIRKTTNPFWVLDSSDTKLKIEGRLLYDGPLPVRDMPLDTNPIERLAITARDECEYSEPMRGAVGHKTFKFSISYPNTVDSDGGDMNDMEVHLDYNEVGHYPTATGGDGPCSNGHSDVEDKYDSVCDSNSGFAVIFTDSDGLSDEALDDFDRWDLISVLKESEGWVYYDFEECDDSQDNCDEKMIESGDMKSSVLDANRVYLLWVGLTRFSKGKTYYTDFNLERIKFKNKYWDAKFRDEDDDFNNNITKDGTRLDELWKFDGMSEMAYRYSDDSNKTKIFRRRELAGYVPDNQ